MGFFIYMEKKIKIAIQKSGRLMEGSLSLLKQIGIIIENGKDQLKATARNFPAEILFLRNSDIPQYLEDGVVDLAIVGENLLVEKQKATEVLLKLDFSKCRVSLAIPKAEEYTGLDYFNGKRIATSYPNTLHAFLESNGLNCDIHEISGSVEIAPNIGLADGICDLVSSGSTLFKNGLQEVEMILKSEAVLTSGQNLDADIKKMVDQIVFRLKSVLAAKNNRYVLLNAPDEQLEKIIEVLPGMKSPTVLPLALSGWSSVHSVIGENKFWEIIEQLKAAGAEGILIIPIEKMVL